MAFLQRLRPHNVAVFRALQLGDMLCAVPALRALRGALPAARVTLVGLPWAAAFAARFRQYVDAFLSFPGHPGLPEQSPRPAEFDALIGVARGQRFDLAIQLHGNGRITNGIVAQLGAAMTAGFVRSLERNDHAFLPYPQRGPEIRRLLALTRFLGAATRGEALEFPLDARDEAELDAFAAARGLPRGRCICVHAGARAPDKRWPPERFAAVADALHAATGLPIVLTGSEAERGVTAAVMRAMRSSAFDAAGPISVGALAAQLARARLLVTNDTGVSHLAAALRVPSVVIFSASQPERWAPLDATLHRAVWDPAGQRTAEVLMQAHSLLSGAGSARAPARAPGPPPR